MPSRDWQNDHRAAILARRCSQGRARVIHHLVRDQTRVDPRGETAWLVARRCRHLRACPSELRLLAQSPLRYRRQVLALKHFFTSRNTTVILLDDLSAAQDDLQLHSIAHGVILLEQLAIEYGAERRRLRVVKMRGIPFRGGFHDFSIETGGLRIFPRLIAAEHHKAFAGEYTPSGNAELDKLLGGGLERGTNALLIGGAGVGKSSLALTYAIAAAERGEHAVFFAFDEGRGTLEARARTLGLPLQQHLDSGLIRFQQIDPAELSPGEFAAGVRMSVERDNARIVIIDSLNGYLNAMRMSASSSCRCMNFSAISASKVSSRSSSWRSMGWLDPCRRRSTSAISVMLSSCSAISSSQGRCGVPCRS